MKGMEVRERRQMGNAYRMEYKEGDERRGKTL